MVEEAAACWAGAEVEAAVRAVWARLSMLSNMRAEEEAVAANWEEVPVTRLRQ